MEVARLDYGQLLRRLSVPLCFVAIIIFFGAMAPNAFLVPRTLTSILASAAPIVVLTIATVVTLRGGDYDLSVAAVMTLSANIVGVLNIRYGMDIGSAMGIAIAMAVSVGLVNAFFCILVGIDSFIMTLGMGTILAGITLWISNSNSYTGLSDWLVVLITNRDILGLPFSFYIAVAISLIIWIVFEFTPIGRQHLFVGKSREVSKLNGIAVGRVRTLSFVSCSVLAAVAGIMYVGAAGGVDPHIGAHHAPPGLRSGIPRIHHDHARSVQSVGRLPVGVLPRHRHNRVGHPRIADLRTKLLLRWRAHLGRVARPVEQNRRR